MNNQKDEIIDLNNNDLNKNSENSVHFSENSKNKTIFTKKQRRATIYCLTATLAAFQIGFSFGFGSAVSDELKNNRQMALKMNIFTFSWFSSIITAAAIVGSLISVILMKKFGKITTIRVCYILFIFGWALISVASSLTILFIGRVLTGFGVGFGFSVIPLYIGEISPIYIRGILGTIFNAVVAFGIPCAYLVSVYVTWKQVAIFGIICASIGIFSSILLIESPFWLAKAGKVKEAKKVFLNLLDDDEEEIRLRIKELQTKKSKFEMKMLTQKRVYKPVMLVLLFSILQQLSGINGVLFNIHFIFKSVNFSNENLASILVGGIQVLVLLLTAKLTDVKGRRVMMLISSLGACCCLLVLGTCLFFTSESNDISEVVMTTNTTEILLQNVEADTSFTAWLALISSVFYIVFFALGLGPVPFILLGELIPVQLNEIVGGIASVMNNLTSLVVIQTFLQVSEIFGISVVFWIYASFTASCFLFTFYFLPEVKGKTFEEIQNLFDEDVIEKEETQFEENSFITA